jgi:RND family efflux transporter MFP subunit
MKSYPFIPIIITLTAALTSACGNQTQDRQSDIATPVSVVELKKGSISKLINTSGTVRPVFGTDILSQIAGDYELLTNKATGKAFRSGDRVEKGQIIIRLTDPEYVNNIALDAKELDLEIALQEQTKQTALYEKGGVTVSEMRNTEVRVTNARHALENARLSILKMEVRAPFAGVITDLPHYTPGVRLEQSKPLASLMDYGSMYMEVHLPESAIRYVNAGQTALVTHYTIPGDTLLATVGELSPAINPDTRTFKAKLVIRNEALKLRPGMFAKADIVVDKADSSVIIPKEAIQTTRDRKYVYVAEKNTAVLRYITTGLEDETQSQVVEGLSENDNLIVRGFEILRENSKIKVQR